MDKQNNMNRWTEEEIKILTQYRTREKPLAYKEIATILTRHTKDSIAQKWQELVHSGKKRTPPTLCEACKHTNRFECSWFDPDNPRPVPGWEAKPKTITYETAAGVRHEIKSYLVKKCPNFEKEII